MRVAMNDAEAAEGKPPRGEHGRGETVARRERVGLVLKQLAPGKPIQREQAAGGQIRPDLRHPDRMFVLQHVAIQFDVLRLSTVVELLAQTCADLDCDLAGVDCRIEALPDSEQQLQLIEIGFDRRLHVRILQLACNFAAIERAAAVHLAQRSGSSRMVIEFGKFLLPVGSELRAHAALDESPPHGRRLALQLDQLVGVFGRQRIGNGGEQLRHLHDRTFQAAQRGGELERVRRTVERHAKETRAGKARGRAAELRADPGVALGARGEPVLFAVFHEANAAIQPRFDAPSI
jgi:hypothetical protein